MNYSREFSIFIMIQLIIKNYFNNSFIYLLRKLSFIFKSLNDLFNICLLDLVQKIQSNLHIISQLSLYYIVI